jgi:TonB family protein
MNLGKFVEATPEGGQMKLRLVALGVALLLLSLQVHAQDASTDEPLILSDTLGYDFGPYMRGVVNRVRQNWFVLIPEIARRGEKGRVVVIFTITRPGLIRDMRMNLSSGNDALDRAAVGAIASSNPFAALPSEFKGDQLALQFTFLYNDKSEEKK